MKLRARSRRRLMGGRADIRLYADNSIRVRVDHPSNDPEVELAMLGRIISTMRRVYAAHGLPMPKLGPITWRDDSEPTAE